ncbi:glycosyltransferase family 2 protein, partial [Zavarzinella formosa]|uniref:glycosyltransferase family 2 protein n=1 Tax=Zavarzinella formosa TaxID=360055 RepID=UPI00138B028B
MSSSPAISIIMPVHNGAGLLGRAVDSIVRQTFADWELLAVDDGSTDDSAARLEERAAADHRIRVFRHPVNRGQSAARNTAINNSRGHLIAYLDHDDEFYPDHLARAWEYRERGDVLVFRYDQIDDRPGSPGFGKTARYDPSTRHERIFAETITTALGVVHRRELFGRAGRFDETIGRHRGEDEDGDLWRRFARAGATFAFVPAASGRYHVRADSLSRTRP